MFFRINNRNRLFIRHKPRKLKKKYELPYEKTLYQFFAPVFWQPKKNRLPKVFGMVNLNHLRLLKHVKASLNQCVFIESASDFKNALGSKPNVKMFLQKRPCWPNNNGRISLQIFYICQRPGVSRKCTKIHPRLGDVGL